MYIPQDNISVVDFTQILKPVQTTITVGTKTQSVSEAFKPKRAGAKTAHVIFVLDDSASMRSCTDSTISAFNEFLESQKKDDKESGIKTYITLFKFDGTNVNKVINHVRAKSVEPLNHETYSPNGWSTNLYDGIGGVILDTNKTFESQKKKDRDSITIAILTDGQENSSKIFRNSDIKAMIEKCESKNWGFVFLGANINAFAVGSTLGFGANNTMQYSTNNMNATLNATANFVNRSKSARAAGLDTMMTYASATFTDEERTEANE